MTATSRVRFAVQIMLNQMLKRGFDLYQKPLTLRSAIGGNIALDPR